MYPNLKLQLWKSGIRQNQLARVLGVDETVLSRIVNGFREPNPQLQQSIANLLRCDASWLFAAQDAGAAIALQHAPLTAQPTQPAQEVES